MWVGIILKTLFFGISFLYKTTVKFKFVLYDGIFMWSMCPISIGQCVQYLLDRVFLSLDIDPNVQLVKSKTK